MPVKWAPGISFLCQLESGLEISAIYKPQRLIWVHALCIDQDSRQVRSHWVCDVGHLSKCQQVLILIREEKKYTATSFEIMPGLTEHREPAIKFV
ncbi:hypothetical protein I7I50_05607 [Histoplasma capsulatum G186AR]|uniref:Heterokaryon incompatibility domain-containing protein n=1 Tax=Ajellomyces capsulatus TaxID=5037 RepID=A0A8H8D893_AJECA|nr:hypothetical protein I7I52_03867 [Histoplasma capsulatum]QSS76227.1 hypothetical protein I7I50_05607 [Histoplasma capsulatum G186AR]